MKNDDKTRGNKPESSGERRKIQKISRQGKNNTDKIRYSKTMERFLPSSREMTKNHNNNRMQGKQNNPGAKYGN